MNDLMLDMALRHFDFNDQQMQRIKAAIPKLAYLTDLVKHHQTVINELIDVFNMAAQQVNRKESQ